MENPTSLFPMWPDKGDRNFTTLDYQKLKSWMERKLSDGDVSGAVRVLCSDDSFAPFTPKILEDISRRHSPPPMDLHMTLPPNNISAPLQLTPEAVEKCVRSFKPGSAAGPGNLSPQYLKSSFPIKLAKLVLVCFGHSQ